MSSQKRPKALKPYATPRKPLHKIIQQVRPKNPPIILDNRLIQSANNHSKQVSVMSPPKLPHKRILLPKPSKYSPWSLDHQHDVSLDQRSKSNLDKEIEPEFEDIADRTGYKTSEQAPADLSNRLASPNDPSSILDLRLQLPNRKPADYSPVSLRQNSAARPPSRVQSRDHLQPLTPFSKSDKCVHHENTDSCAICHVEKLMKSVPNFCPPSTIDLAAELRIPAIRRRASATITRPVEKKARGNIESMATHQMYHQVNYAGDIRNRRSPSRDMNNSAAQFLSNLAHQVHPYDPSQLQFFRQSEQAYGSPIPPKVPDNQRTYTRDPRVDNFQPPLQPQWLFNKSQICAPRNGIAVQMQPVSSLEALLTQDKACHQNQPIEKVQVTEKEPDNFMDSLEKYKDVVRKLKFAKLSVSSIKVDEFPPEITPNSVLETTTDLEEMQSEVRSPEQNEQQLEEREELTEDYQQEVTAQESGYKTDRYPSKQLEAPVSESADDSYYSEDRMRSERVAPIITEQSMDAQSSFSKVSGDLSKESALKLMEAHGVMLTNLYRNFQKTEDYYNDLRMTTLGCLRLYRVMKKCILEDDKESCSVPEPENTVTEELAEEITEKLVQEPAEKLVQEPAEELVQEPAEELVQEPAKELVQEPAEEPAPEPGPAPKNNPKHLKKGKETDSNVKKPEKDGERPKLVLPPEYDPNDSKWTLKYRGPGHRLKELIPHSGIYVRRKEYNKCTRKADSCRKLARTMLPEVFNKNALSVCSVTGAKARAFLDTGIETRPGLDEEARLTFLKFIEDFGKKRHWDTSDTAGIISSIRTKMIGMRLKYEKSLKSQ